MDGCLGVIVVMFVMGEDMVFVMVLAATYCFPPPRISAPTRT